MERNIIAIYASSEATEVLLTLMTLEELEEWLKQNPKGRYVWIDL